MKIACLLAPLILGAIAWSSPALAQPRSERAEPEASEEAAVEDDEAATEVGEAAVEDEEVAVEDDEASPDSLELRAMRPREARYVDALAGSWAATGILTGALGALGMALGTGAGCAVEDDLGCIAGVIGGGVLFAGFGWITGPGVGTAAGAGLNPEEGFLMWGLGFLTNAAVAGLGTAIGFAADSGGGTWGLGRLWGMILGGFLGALSQVFLTPLYAVAIYEERVPAETPEPAVTVAPFAFPIDQGAMGGLSGAF